MHTTKHGRIATVLVVLGLLLTQILSVQPVAASALTGTGLYDDRPINPACTSVPGTSGQTDSVGKLYIVCANGTTIRVLNVDGSVNQEILVPNQAKVHDVAPSPNGSILYVTQELQLDGLGEYNWHPVRRFVLQNGVYQWDTTWKLTDPNGNYDTTLGVEAMFLATDDAGYLYVPSGQWTKYHQDTGLNMVRKYDANGQVVTSFGNHNEGTGSAALGSFNYLTGIAVSKDGQFLYTVEQLRGRVQRFDRNLDGSYANAKGFYWGDNYDPKVGNCSTPPSSPANPPILASPYDIALDKDGNAYIANTTCERIEKYSIDNVQNKAVYTATICLIQGQGCGFINDAAHKPHGLAVNRDGNVYVPQTGTLFYHAVLTQVSPTTGPTAGGITVTLTGRDFSTTGTTTVTFGGVAATAVTVDPSGTQITARTPAHAAGAVDVVVTNTNSGQTTTLPSGFRYTSPTTMTITSISPNHAPTTDCDNVTITGTNFPTTGTTTVTFGGVAASFVTVVNATTITVRGLVHAAGTVDVVVTNSGGQTATLVNGFHFDASPITITGVSPNHGSPTGGDFITITGTNFQYMGCGQTTVTFGGIRAQGVYVDAATAIDVETPAHTSGLVDVVVTSPGGETATLVNGYRYDSPLAQPVAHATAPTSNSNLPPVPQPIRAAGDSRQPQAPPAAQPARH